MTRRFQLMSISKLINLNKNMLSNKNETKNNEKYRKIKKNKEKLGKIKKNTKVKKK